MGPVGQSPHWLRPGGSLAASKWKALVPCTRPHWGGSRVCTLWDNLWVVLHIPGSLPPFDMHSRDKRHCLAGALDVTLRRGSYSEEAPAAAQPDVQVLVSEEMPHVLIFDAEVSASC